MISFHILQILIPFGPAILLQDPTKNDTKGKAITSYRYIRMTKNIQVAKLPEQTIQLHTYIDLQTIITTQSTKAWQFRKQFESSEIVHGCHAAS